MIKVNPKVIHDKNDRYTPVMIDLYLPTFTSASRPNKGNKKKIRQYPISKIMWWAWLLTSAYKVAPKLLMKLKWVNIEKSQRIISSADRELIKNLDIFPVYI